MSKIVLTDGLHGLNNIFTRDQWHDILTAIQTVFIIAIGISTIMMIVSPGGILFSAMRLPIWQNIMLLAEDPTLPIRAHPEQGMHWTTVLTYSWEMLISITFLKKRFTPLHNIVFSICLFMASFVFPFEWIYVSLLDIFHNIPVQGFWMSTTMYGYWRITWFPPILNWLGNSVIGRNGIMAMGLVFGTFVALDNYRFASFWDGVKIFYNWDRTSKILLASVLIGFTIWIVLPMFPILGTYQQIKGSIYFPQDIYVWYGPSVNATKAGDLWDIVREEWVPDIPVRIINTIVKTLSVLWVSYTFIPFRSKKHKYWS